MKARIDYTRVAPQILRPLFSLQGPIESSGIEPAVLELVKMRASQINGCAYCLDMHSKDARAEGETEQRLYLLNAWREAPSLYSERERAALAWTEAVTLVSEGHVPDAVYEEVRGHFTEQELVALTLAVVAINGWNRLNVAFRMEAGSYRPGMFKQLFKTA
jgi:AhpD family alkylhydroperoxidase